MHKKINIAIDGYSSCGKGTLAKEIANHLNYIFIDSGAMYRAVTLYLIQQNVPLDQESEIEKQLEHIHLKFNYVEQNQRYEIFLNGMNVESQIRELAVASKVSLVAKNSSVRKKLVHLQQEMGKLKGVVMDGRDIGTVVFPDAELKIFMTASNEIRSKRRYDEMIRSGMNVTLEEVAANLLERDQIDSQRSDSPLTYSDKYKLLDNTNLDKNEQFELALSWVRELIG